MTWTRERMAAPRGRFRYYRTGSNRGDRPPVDLACPDAQGRSRETKWSLEFVSGVVPDRHRGAQQRAEYDDCCAPHFGILTEVRHRQQAADTGKSESEDDCRRDPPLGPQDLSRRRAAIARIAAPATSAMTITIAVSTRCAGKV